MHQSCLSNWVIAYRVGEKWNAVKIEIILLLLIMKKLQNKSFAYSAKICILTSMT